LTNLITRLDLFSFSSEFYSSTTYSPRALLYWLHGFYAVVIASAPAAYLIRVVAVCLLSPSLIQPLHDYGAEEHYEDNGEDEEHQREYHFNRGFKCKLLGALHAPFAVGIRLNTERTA